MKLLVQLLNSFRVNVVKILSCFTVVGSSFSVNALSTGPETFFDAGQFVMVVDKNERWRV